MSYTPINYVRMQRVTAQEMNYIQTQYRNCEKLRVVDSFPATAEEGELLYLNTDRQIYSFDGVAWIVVGTGGSGGGFNLPILDGYPLLKNKDNPSKIARFDLSLISNATTRIYYLPNEDGTFALFSQVPKINGDTERSILYRGTTNTEINTNRNILIGKELTQPYLEINKETDHVEDIIKYKDGNEQLFRVTPEGKTVTKRLCLFSGASG
jgi:hypothetical protein